MTTTGHPEAGAPEEAAPRPAADSVTGLLWAVVLGAGLAGLAFTTVQVIEKITILTDPGATLVCDVNATISCTDVLNAWQSSVLGPPNSLIGAVMFTAFLSAAAAGLMGSRLSRSYLAALWGLAVFFLGFATWFMYETAFSIERLCPWCIGITSAVVAICAALTRIAHREGAFGQTGLGTIVTRGVRRNLDLVVWAVWWLAIGAFLVIGLGG